MIPVILTSLFAGLIYISWMIFTAVKRRWKKLGYQLSAGVCGAGLMYFAITLHARYEFERYLTGLFRVSAKLSSPLFSYDSAPALNGDGYSISIYELPKEIRQIFETFDEKEVAEFPKRPDHRKHWKTSAWHATPALAGDQKYLNFALSFIGTEKVIQHQQALRALVAKKGAYLAYFYFSPIGHPSNVDLFVVDLAGDKFYLINLNT